jgi:hypothetical protein
VSRNGRTLEASRRRQAESNQLFAGVERRTPSSASPIGETRSHTVFFWVRWAFLAPFFVTDFFFGAFAATISYD